MISCHRIQDRCHQQNLPSGLKKDARPGVVALALIPTLGRLRQEDHEFKVNLGYMVRPCLKKRKKRKEKKEQVVPRSYEL
jgi:hypothetical protein